MDELSPLTRFDRAASAAGTVFSGVKPEQFDDPTPCTEWTVRQLMNHVVGGNHQFISMLTGGGQLDRSLDYLGADPPAAFRESVARLRALFAAEGALERPTPTPFGERPGVVLLEMRVTEMMTHGWDLARATGQPTDLDPAVAERCIQAFRVMRASGRGADMFDEEQPAPDGASPADRLAAAAGRRV
jgi:uncharacterized protein (TIGR03086 family)